MFTTELIVGTGTNKKSLDLTQEIPVSLNFSIGDIRQPDKRSGSFSKTIKLYGTKTNNKFFEHIYEVNIVTNTFNRNLKTPCYIIQDGCVVVEGNLRLLQIEKILQNDIEEITYEVAILGDISTIFTEIGDNKLTDLDLSAYNHTYTRVNQYNSWSATQGVGYVYPIIDYGFNSFSSNYFSVEYLRPAIYLKQYVDKIFAAAGKTYTSTFFSSAFFKSLIIPFNGDKFTMSAATRLNYEALIGDDGTQAAINVPLTYGTSWYDNSGTASDNFDLNLVTSDPSSQYTGGVFTCANRGTYEVKTNMSISVKFNHSSFFTSVVPYQTSGVQFAAVLYWRPNSSSSWSYVETKTGNYTGTFTGAYSTFAIPINFTPQSLGIGNELKVTYYPISGGQNVGVKFWDGAAWLTTGTASMDAKISSASTLNFKLQTGDYMASNTLTIADAIPKDIKQKDLLTSIVKMFNLYFDIDQTNSNNYLIETRDDFYAAGSSKDWSDKLAWDKPFVIKPMTEVDYKRFIYTYKSDQDYYNKRYTDAEGDVYGTKNLDVTNDWTKNENKTEVIFSASPVSDNANNDLVIPRILTYDGTTVKPAKHNIRILMYNGVKNNATPYTFYNPTGSDSLGAASLPLYTYAQAGMVNDAMNPTDSIEFGVPNQVFYSPTTYTNNTLYNKYYSRFMNEITDRDSAIVTAYFYLTAKDIAEFDFRDIIYVKDIYYFVNKIMDYNPLKSDLTKVELLKVKEYDAFSPATSTVTTIETDSGSTGIAARLFGLADGETNTNDGGLVLGSGNSNRAAGSIITGNRNSIGMGSYNINFIACDLVSSGYAVSGSVAMSSSGCTVGNYCSNINLQNCFNVTVDPYVTNFTGINLNNVNITTANSGTVMLGSMSNPEVGYALKTASFTVDPAISVYEIDCSAGNITATFGFASYTYSTQIWYFKRIDATANTFTIDEASGLRTIDGNPVPYNTGAVQWDDIPVFYNGTNFIIL